MHYNKPGKIVPILILITFTLYSCAGKERKNASNTFYVELIHFNDSLKEFISSSISGKAAFYKNEKLQIFSLNYLTEDYPDIHYFKPIEEIGKQVKPGSHKIRIEFEGNYSIDSIKYFIKKYKFRNNQWIKTSDMGFIKGFSSYKNLKEFATKEYGNQIINNIAAYSFN